jgi:hypothetical protein
LLHQLYNSHNYFALHYPLVIKHGAPEKKTKTFCSMFFSYKKRKTLIYGACPMHFPPHAVFVVPGDTTCSTMQWSLSQAIGGIGIRLGGGHEMGCISRINGLI